MFEDGHGRCHGRFTLPALHGAMLRKQLMAIAAPKHRAQVDGLAPEPGRPSAHRLGEAFAEYIETYPTDRLPKAGGVSATVVVTMTVETLMGGLKAAQLDTGHRISPGLARRLACRAGIIPAVLGAKSQVLDLGRKRRFHTEPQRIALAIEQGGCTAEGCDWPPGMCHAHHDQPWSDRRRHRRQERPTALPPPPRPRPRPGLHDRPSSPAARSGSTDERESLLWRSADARWEAEA